MQDQYTRINIQDIHEGVEKHDEQFSYPLNRTRIHTDGFDEENELKLFVVIFVAADDEEEEEEDDDDEEEEEEEEADEEAEDAEKEEMERKGDPAKIFNLGDNFLFFLFNLGDKIEGDIFEF